MTEQHGESAKTGRPYQSPKLVVFGDFRQITLTTAGTGGRADGGVGANTKQNSAQ
jgi:hypothetical protein